jgi:hypothetical protein
VASAEVTASTDRLSAASVGQIHPAGPPLSAAGTAGQERHCGAVTCWKPDRRFGFVRDTGTGESFWFSPKRFVYPDSVDNLSVGAELAFVAVGTAEGKKSRQAGAILLAREQADGPLVSQPAG